MIEHLTTTGTWIVQGFFFGIGILAVTDISNALKAIWKHHLG